MKEGPTDILVFTHSINDYYPYTAVLIVNKPNKKLYSFITTNIAEDKAVLFKHVITEAHEKILKDFIDRIIEQGGFFFNNQYVNITIEEINSPILYNGMKIFLT